MASVSEKSFGARLRNAQNLHQFVTTFSNFNPLNPDDSPAAINALLNNIIVVNNDIATHLQNYQQAVDVRHNAFKDFNNNLSLNKRLAVIRGFVEAQYGKTSQETQKVATIIKELRDGRLIKTEKTIDTKGLSSTHISTSQQSYGSRTQTFNNLIRVLDTLPNYAPTLPDYTPASLQQFCDQLTVYGDNVANAYARITQIRDSRIKLYKELTLRASRIKAYIKAQYGNKSVEHRLTSGLAI